MKNKMLTYRLKSIIVVIIEIVFLLLIVIFACRKLKIEKPTYSKQSGFYEMPFKLKIVSSPKACIYYTLDGTEPTTNSIEYQSPIYISDASENDNYYANISGMSGSYGDYFPPFRIDKATVVKSISVINGISSEVSTGVFFVGYQDKIGYKDMKIMSMVVDPDDLFSDRGIYVIGKLAGGVQPNVEYDPGNYPANYNIESKKMRCKAYVMLWDSNKNLLNEENLSIGIHGGWSKSFRQKGFNFYTDDEDNTYKDNLGKYMLRTSGFRDTFQTMFRDVLNQELVADREMATQESSPCILFINGEYWGIYNLQERYNEEYFKDKYNIDKDNIIVIKTGSVSQGETTDIKYYDELISYATTHDLSIQENYDAISKMMDIQSFIDYYCAECYIANIDWPINNNCCFRSRNIKHDSKYEDGRWRWAMFDTDDSDNIVAKEHPAGGGADTVKPVFI